MRGRTGGGRTIGRGAESEALARVFTSCLEGTPRTVVITGEAGIGKSRLVDDFLAGLPADTLVAQGECLSPHVAVPPLAPIRRMLRSVHEALGADAFRAAVGGGAGTVDTLMGFGEAEPNAVAPPSMSRLSEAIATLLRTVSRERPVVLVLHDMHWADEGTLGLALSLVGMLEGCPIMTVLTRRTADGAGPSQLRALLAEIDQSHRVTRIELERLDRAQVAELVAALGLASDSTEELDLLYERSGGVPLFVEELAGRTAGDLPASVSEMALVRYESLSASARRFVECLAVGTPHLKHDLVCRALDAPVAEVDAAAREALDSGLITTNGSDYAFRHPLLGEAVYHHLAPGPRRHWHARFADALGRGTRPDPVVIANHLIAADVVPDAAVAALAAMGQCRAEFAFARAARFGDYVLSVWDDLPAPDASWPTRWELLAEVGTDWVRAGEVDAAMPVFERAVAACPPEERHGHERLAALIAAQLPAASRLPAGALTVREREVLTLLGLGLSNREIGARLFISHKTVSVHVSAILAKLHVSSRTQAAVWAERAADAS